MKLRSALLLLAALLPAAGLAGASTSPAAASGDPAVSSAKSAPISFDKPAECGFSRFTPAIAGLTPAPTPLGTYNTCGSCSQSPCKGATIGVGCGVRNGHYATCQSPYGNNCSDGITWQCQCWVGPLP